MLRTNKCLKQNLNKTYFIIVDDKIAFQSFLKRIILIQDYLESENAAYKKQHKGK